MALSPEGATPFVVGAARIVLGTLTLALFCLFLRQKVIFIGWPWKWVMLYAVCVWAYQIVFFSAVDLIGVAAGTLIAQGSVPIFAGGVQWLIYRQAPSKIWYAEAAVGILGLALINGTSGASFSLPGFVCALLAGFITAMDFVAAKKVAVYRSPLEGMLIVMLFASALMAPFFFLFPASWIFTPKGAFCMGMLGIFNCGAAFLLQFIGMKTTSPAMASVIALAEPLGAALIGILILHETADMMTFLGASCLFASVALAVVRPEKDIRA